MYGDYDNRIERRIDNHTVLLWIAMGMSLISLIVSLMQFRSNSEFKRQVNLAMTSSSSAIQRAADAALVAQISGKNAAAAATMTAANAAAATNAAKNAMTAANTTAARAAIANSAANDAAAAASTTRDTIKTADDTQPQTSASTAVALPGGTTVQLNQDSAAQALYNILNNPDADTSQALHISGINFMANSARLTPDSMGAIQQLATVLRAYPTTTIRVEGHTDSMGDANHNLRLSTARAQVVRTALARYGVASNRIEAQGLGQQQPIADNGTAEGQAQNRRVDMIVLNR